MKFSPIKTLSRNKASVDDTYIINDVPKVVTQISGLHVHLNDGSYFPKKLFNSWVRICLSIETRNKQSKSWQAKLKNQLDEVSIMRKEAKSIYDKKYRQPAVNRLGKDTTLKPYIILTGVGKTAKFYFSPTDKADIEDLELSYKSLHGTAYSAFAWGHYIQHEHNIALIGMNKFKERNLSDKRKAFAISSLEQCRIDNIQVNVKLYDSMTQMFNHHAEIEKLLSSESASEKKHWSGLNGDIATSMLDQALDNEYSNDNDYPF